MIKAEKSPKFSRKILKTLKIKRRASSVRGVLPFLSMKGGYLSYAPLAIPGSEQKIFNLINSGFTTQREEI